MSAFQKALEKKKGKHKHVKGKDGKCKECGKEMEEDEYVQIPAADKE